MGSAGVTARATERGTRELVPGLGAPHAPEAERNAVTKAGAAWATAVTE